MPDLLFNATINGRKIARSAKPHQRLLDLIRDTSTSRATRKVAVRVSAALVRCS